MKAHKPKRKRCVVCLEYFLPFQSLQRCCDLECALIFSKREMVKKSKRETRAKLEELKNVRQLLKEARHAFNAFIRQRDQGLPCICCGRLPLGEAFTGGSWDAGHFRGTGAAPHLQFHEDNCHRQLSVCNRGAGGGNYRQGIVARIGLARVEALENDNSPHKWSRDEVREIRDRYRLKLRELKQAMAA